MSRDFYQMLETIITQGKYANIITSFVGRNGSLTEGLSKKVQLQEEFVFTPMKKDNEDKTFFYEPIAPKERLILLGGGHIALPLCEFAAKTGFQVVVVDDRIEFANSLRFPQASRVVCDGFSRALEHLVIGERDYVVIITRGHRYDADCLRYLLKQTMPYYLGMIGSRRRVKGLFEMLVEEGYDKSCMGKICTPIGLDIGAILPEEIAISIIAELILYKRKQNPHKEKANISSDLDLDVIQYLANTKEEVSVVTVMQTKGSTPRGAGAKMAVNRLGKVYGSIGGGCAEKDIIDIARKMIGTNTYQTVTIDMTGDVAESEGMVCGGTMDVLIEDFSISD